MKMTVNNTFIVSENVLKTNRGISSVLEKKRYKILQSLSLEKSIKGVFYVRRILTQRIRKQ